MLVSRRGCNSEKQKQKQKHFPSQKYNCETTKVYLRMLSAQSNPKLYISILSAHETRIMAIKKSLFAIIKMSVVWLFTLIHINSLLRVRFESCESSCCCVCTYFSPLLCWASEREGIVLCACVRNLLHQI